MVRVLHTADWHIGKQLHKYDLEADMVLFFDWLVDTIKKEKIDLILVSGDVFDLSNPSHADESLYFKTVGRLIQTGVRIVITGGNHDSVALLDAPRPILDNFNTHVIGGARENLEEEIIPIFDKKGVLNLCVLAVPYLREKDIRSGLRADQMSERHKIIKENIIQHYKSLVEIVKQKYGEKVPIIAMGHLFISGSLTSDSEREIHVGTLDGLKDDWIDECGIDYMALGHIHKPQRVGGRDHIRYSGSPIFLDFSEREYAKQCIQIDIEDFKIKEIKSLSIPTFRKLVRICGSFQEVTKALDQLEDHSTLPTFVDVEIGINDQEIEVIRLFEEYINARVNDNFIIVKQKFVNTSDTPHHISKDHHTKVAEMQPMDVFFQRLSTEDLDGEFKDQLVSCYREILDSIDG
jgi:exonuclease SbcD